MQKQPMITICRLAEITTPPDPQSFQVNLQPNFHGSKHAALHETLGDTGVVYAFMRHTMYLEAFATCHTLLLYNIAKTKCSSFRNTERVILLKQSLYETFNRILLRPHRTGDIFSGFELRLSKARINPAATVKPSFEVFLYGSSV